MDGFFYFNETENMAKNLEFGTISTRFFQYAIYLRMYININLTHLITFKALWKNMQKKTLHFP